MAEWKKSFLKLGHRAETEFDRLKARLEKRLARDKPIQILIYRGFGTVEGAVHVKGRVLRDKPIAPATDNDTVWRNMLSVYRRFESDELADVRLHVRFGELEEEVVTDEEGYFTVVLEGKRPFSSHTLWHPITVTLLDELVENQGVIEAEGQVIFPNHSSSFGVISDIDDTILQTFATNLIKVAQLTFLHNAYTRLPFAGVAAFYQALQAGGAGANPIFYVSSSPWNLYDLLSDFMELNEIPAGPIFLRDLGLDSRKMFALKHKEHKLGQIRHLLTTYPDLPFILIGDSGQEDPEIYREAVELFPDRILAIYIRDVSRDERDAEIRSISQELAADVPLLLVPDTYAAAQHAAANGFIPFAALPKILQDRDANPTHEA
ncbi:MAG: phosphatase domain-containing protein [Chloroflexota bacterium]